MHVINNMWFIIFNHINMFPTSNYIKHNMTICLKSLVLLILAITFNHEYAYATERIDRINYKPDHGTLVRYLGNDTSVICDQWGVSVNAPSFFLVTPFVTSTMIPRAIIDIDTVFDFEIYNDVVYFCGVKNTATGGYGVIGYFHISGFPAPSVNYLNIPVFRRITRLEVGDMQGSTHIVAIGDGIHGKAELVDAIDFGASWSINLFDAADANYKFLDLAITDTHVIVASAYRDVLLRFARVLYFKKPSVPSPNPITYISCLDLSIVVGIDCIVKSCEDDAFVLAISDGEVFYGTSSFTIIAYNGTNHISTNHIMEQMEGIYLKDIEYYAQDRKLEVLLYSSNPNSRYSVIYNLTQTMASTNIWAYGHKYDNAEMMSLDLCRDQPGCFVSSGINWANYSRIDQLFYTYNQWGDCLTSQNKVVKKINSSEKDKEFLYGFVDYEQSPSEKVASEKYERITNICISSKDL